MTRTKSKHKKPTHAELDKMERIKSLLEGEGSKMNTVPIVQSKVEITKVNHKQDNSPCVTYKNKSVKLRDIKISDHANLRSMQRWNIQDKSIVNSKLKNLLLEAKQIGETFDEKGKPAILFAKDKNGIYLKPDLSEIITMIPYEKTYTSVKTKIVEFLEKEVRKLDRLEKIKIKHITELKFVTDIEIAELRYQIHKSKSKVFINVATSRINAIKQSIDEYESEIEYIRKEKTKISKTIVGFN